MDAPFRQSRVLRSKRSSRGLLALYEFGKSTSAEIADSTGSGGVLKLASADAMFAARTGGRFIVRSPLLLTSENPPKALIEACRVSNEVTIEALVAPANNTQTGPYAYFRSHQEPESATSLWRRQEIDMKFACEPQPQIQTDSRHYSAPKEAQ